jgi:4-hydroxy-tetrahydrodipicolinate synthase
VITLDNDLLRGSYPPIVTPFRAGGDVDLDHYEQLVEMQVAAGSHGIVVNGTTAEPSTLTVGERKDLAERAIATVGGRIPVVVATGSQSLAETVELTAHAERCGAGAVLVVSPYYIRPPQRGLVEYFVEVAAHTRLPVLLYNIPGRSAVAVTLATLDAIADRVPHFVGMKHAHPDLGLVSDAIACFGANFRVLVGLEELSFPMLALGAAGMVNAVANVAPREVAALYEAVAAGKLDEGRRLHYALLELNRAIFFDTNPIPLKYMLKRLGHLDGNRHRLPMVPATDEIEAKCDGVLARAGLM